MVHVFDFADGFLTKPRTLALRDEKKRGIPAGIAVAADGTVYAANVWGQTLSRVRSGKKGPVVTELPLAERHEAPAERAPTTDDPSITKREEAQKETTKALDPFPYACVLGIASAACRAIR